MKSDSSPATMRGRDQPSGREAISSLLGRLVDRGLLDERDIVDGDVRVVDASRRNRNLRVTTGLGASYFIKQGLGGERSTTIGREAGFLLRAAASPLGARMGAHLPTVRDWDAERSTLVFDLAPGASSLAQYQQQARRWPGTLAEQAGRALAALHTSNAAWPAAAELCLTDVGAPFVLSIHRPPIDIFDRMSGAGLEIVRIVQSAATIGTALDDLRQAWLATAIIHGDIKWDNVVVSPAPGGRGRRLHLVDWELVQLGDPLWDAASFLSQYLDAWVSSIPAIDYAELSQSSGAQLPLERLQPAMQRFWEAYAHGVGLGGPARSAALEQVSRYAAARLIHTCFEAEQSRVQLSNTSVLRLQVAQNMLQRPLVAAASLFGVTG